MSYPSPTDCWLTLLIKIEGFSRGYLLEEQAKGGGPSWPWCSLISLQSLMSLSWGLFGPSP